ncbi:enoyl-CoA hydratase/isomerase family protein [Spongiactinospora sp. TRM90649]|uniref:enoyl-CoA hydratase/isomerase family protein n=1 Tax=Spongiactinospora sp. TRM90649 TaxID=3031114 RepID=UPI0023F9B989|nr:enoyl-CoA hydratase/isomerase family protein [Spongiactinospora sp. TRM90649]MDF5756951.1 enoyl-CoA hydratase/isomerase family protein [Spongiactinospora sp. TRM90649]
MSSAAPSVGLDRPSPHVGLITLNHPPANTLGRAMRARLVELLTELDRDPEIRCLVLTGTGTTFTAGADLRENRALHSPADADGERVEAFLGDFDRVLCAVEDFRTPVIAAVNGAAVGGGLELAMACDIRLAASDAVFVAAGVNVGLIANFWRLTRIVGLGPAKEILLTGERYGAEEALRWGLVTGVHAPADLLPAALAKAERVASRPPLSAEATKACANLAHGLTREQATALQARYFQTMVRTADHREALDAFFARRPGHYQRH